MVYAVTLTPPGNEAIKTTLVLRDGIFAGVAQG